MAEWDSVTETAAAVFFCGYSFSPVYVAEKDLVILFSVEITADVDADAAVTAGCSSSSLSH